MAFVLGRLFKPASTGLASKAPRNKVHTLCVRFSSVVLPDFTGARGFSRSTLFSDPVLLSAKDGFSRNLALWKKKADAHARGIGTCKKRLPEYDINTSLARIVPPARLGRATSDDYRETFFAANPAVDESQTVVHHAIEQQVFRKRYKGVITEEELNSLENLRGIPKKHNSKIHLSLIRMEWNDFYEEHPTATKEQLLEKATDIDRKYGQFFDPKVGE